MSRAAEWLSLAAAPTFAFMALLTALSSLGPVQTICSAGPGSPAAGMAAMYLLMAAFHTTPWLRRADRRTSER